MLNFYSLTVRLFAQLAIHRFDLAEKSTYLNMTAGTDYNLPVLMGEHSKLVSK